MKMKGTKAHNKPLSEKIEPNTFIAVISDKEGVTRTIQINRDSIPENEVFLSVETGCFVRINGYLIWKDPCPPKD